MLPRYARFRDLKAAGIVANWTTLGNMIRGEGFPAGTKLSKNIRVWPVADVEQWLATRQNTPAPPRGIARRNHEAAGAERGAA